MGDEHLAEYVVGPTRRTPDGGGVSLTGDGSEEVDDERAGDYPLVRFLFPLPSPLPVPSGWGIGMEPGKGSPPDCPMAFLIFWQEQYRLDTLSFEHDATMRVVDRLALGGEPQDVGDRRNAAEEGPSEDVDGAVDGDPLLRTITVVDAITRWHPIVEGPAGWDGEPENLDPKYDPIVRCVALARQVSRAFRLVDGRYIDLISYERLPLALMLFHSSGRIDRERLHIPPAAEWHTSGVMTLNHWNLPPDAADAVPAPELIDAAAHWMRSLRTGVPARAREILQEARIAMRQLGEYGEAVVKANTGCEVLMDSFLSAMLWEEHFADKTQPDAEAWGQMFAEGKVKARFNTMMAPRLKGDWTSPRSPVVKWLAGPHALRHRVVHGGYEPTRQEAADAIRAVDDLSVFLFDQLAARRNKYMRVALMLLGNDGLEARDMVKGRIRTFMDQVANTEESYLDSWGSWHQRLVATAAASR